MERGMYRYGSPPPFKTTSEMMWFFDFTNLINNSPIYVIKAVRIYAVY
jgi:hypothetical protein